MNTPPRLRRDTRVFISAVTKELGSVRKLVESGLKANDYHAVEQADFSLSYLDLIDKLRERISTCDAVIHIAGRCYGSEPKALPDGVTRRSYTQLEYDIAKELEKPVYVFITAKDFPADLHEPEADELAELQAAHCQHLARTGQDYNRPKSREELDQQIRSLQLKVERLEEELTLVDQKVETTGRQLAKWLAVCAGLVVCVLAGQAWLKRDTTALTSKTDRIKQTTDDLKRTTESGIANVA